MSNELNLVSEDTFTEQTDGIVSAINDIGGRITVDTSMSDSSTNAVQNKVIKEYVDAHGVTFIECSINEQTGGIESTTTYAEILEAATQGSVVFKISFIEQIVGAVSLIAAIQSSENVIEVVVGTQEPPYIVHTSGAPNDTFSIGA